MIMYDFMCIFYFADALTPSQVAEALHLHKLSGHKWYINGACATTGEGIYESLKQMALLVKEHKKSAHLQNKIYT